MLIPADGAAQNPCPWASQSRSQHCDPNHTGPSPAHGHPHPRRYCWSSNRGFNIVLPQVVWPKGFPYRPPPSQDYKASNKSALFSLGWRRFESQGSKIIYNEISDLQEESRWRQLTKGPGSLDATYHWGPRAFAWEWVKWSWWGGGGEVSGLLDMGAPWTVVPKSIGKPWWGLQLDGKRLSDYKGCPLRVRVDGIMKMGMFEQASCKPVVSPLPLCLMGMALTPGSRNTFPAECCKPKLLIKSKCFWT